MLGRQLLRARDDARMDDGVKRTELVRFGKHHRTEFLPVNTAVGIENLLAEVVDDFLIGSAAGFNRLMPNAVSIDDVRAEILKVSRHSALSACDAPRKSKGDHGVRSPRSEVRYMQSVALLAPRTRRFGNSDGRLVVTNH